MCSPSLWQQRRGLVQQMLCNTAAKEAVGVPQKMNNNGLSLSLPSSLPDLVAHTFARKQGLVSNKNQATMKSLTTTCSRVTAIGVVVDWLLVSAVATPLDDAAVQSLCTDYVHPQVDDETQTGKRAFADWEIEQSRVSRRIF